MKFQVGSNNLRCMPLAEDHTIKKYLANFCFEKALPRAGGEKLNNPVVANESMAAMMAEKEAKI